MQLSLSDAAHAPDPAISVKLPTVHVVVVLAVCLVYVTVVVSVVISWQLQIHPWDAVEGIKMTPDVATPPVPTLT